MLMRSILGIGNNKMIRSSNQQKIRIWKNVPFFYIPDVRKSARLQALVHALCANRI